MIVYDHFMFSYGHKNYEIETSEMRAWVHVYVCYEAVMAVSLTGALRACVCVCGGGGACVSGTDTVAGLIIARDFYGEKGVRVRLLR